MWNFLVVFDDEDSDVCGEQIFVQRDTIEEADDFMFSDENPYVGEHFHYAGRYTDEEADYFGYDTY